MQTYTRRSIWLITFLISILIFFSTSLFAQDRAEVSAAKKPGENRQVTAFVVTSTKLTTQGSLKRVGPKKVKKGEAVTFIATPRKGYKAAILVNGQLKKYQKDPKKSATQKISNGLKGGKKNTPRQNPPLEYELRGVKSDTSVQALFVPFGQPYAQGLSIYPILLGSSVKVSNRTPALFQGVAASSVGVKTVTWSNKTTGQNGKAEGTVEWQASLALLEGDNAISFRLTTPDGASKDFDTTVTYYPTLDFTSQLHVSKNTIFATHKNVPVTFTLGLSSGAGSVVELLRTDAHGVVDPSELSVPMLDGGRLPDEIQSDNVFTTQLDIHGTLNEYRHYRAKVTKGASTFYSEVVKVWITEPFTSEELEASFKVEEQVEIQYAKLTASGLNQVQSFAAIYSELSKNPTVKIHGEGTDSAIWWITTQGVIGFFNPIAEGTRGGGEARGVPPAIIARPASGEMKFAYYPKEYLSTELTTVTDSPRVLAATTDDEENRIKSNKAVLISPFIANPNFSNNFSLTDDYFIPWRDIKEKVSACVMKAEKEAINNGYIGVSAADFTDLSPFGLVDISTHGAVVFSEKLIAWDPAWGPDDFLKGSGSQVILYSGQVLPISSDGTIHVEIFAEDLKARRVVVNRSGLIGLLPGYFSAYLSALPNSLVVLNACRSAANLSLVSQFRNKGAGAVIGYTNVVASSYTQAITADLYQAVFVDGKTVTEGLTLARQNYGLTDHHGAAPSLSGRFHLKAPKGKLENGGFEDGVLSPWESEGDGRILSGLGGTGPTEGSLLGIISTGLGYTTENGLIKQDFCVSEKDISLSLNWNFMSEEFLEFCKSRFQDTFTAKLCEIDQYGNESNCTTLVEKTVDDLCTSVFPVPIHFDVQEGDVHSTGWQYAAMPLQAYKDKAVRLRLYTTDVADAILDTAVLLDNIKVESEE